MKTTAMCWGFECGDGWYNIIDVLCSRIQTTIDHQNNHRKDDLAFNQMLEDIARGDYQPFDEYYHWLDGDRKLQKLEEVKTKKPREVRPEHPQTVAVQVKEKFGGLRFYVQEATSEIHNYIEFAESMSYRTCEECGSPGTVYTDGWHTTLCDIHAAMNGRTKRHEDENYV